MARPRTIALPLVILLGAVSLLTSGCAMKRDMDLALHEIHILQQGQKKIYSDVLRQIEARSGQLEADQQYLSDTQTEFSSEADAIRGEMARLGAAMVGLQQELADASQRLKTLQNNQAIGLGSLSGRIDDAQDKLGTQIDTQGKTLDSFATEIATQVDGQATQVAKLGKVQKGLSGKAKKRDQSIADLSKTLETLGQKLSTDLSALSKRVSTLPKGSGNGGADVSALKKQVDFLGEKLPAQVDKVSKKNASLASDMREYQTLLADLNKRLKALEAR
jgi:chromosome segregation ATPase